MAEDAKWYVVHTYSGYENTVKATIEKYVENRGMQELIHEISIPLETVTEITDNGSTSLGPLSVIHEISIPRETVTEITDNGPK